MKIDKDTKKCISIAERPGIFGLEFHNQVYELLGLNYIYLPLKVLPNQLNIFIEILRNNFHGCGVSRPHKETIIPYLDEIESSARKIGAVNTILNKNGKLVGYNTDYYGVKKALEFLDIKGKDVLMLGAGGAAKAVAAAVSELGGCLTITNRTFSKAKDLAERFGAEYIDWKRINSKNSKFLLINTTAIGFENKEQMPIEIDSLHNYDAIMDIVIGETRLLKEARVLKKIIIPGKTMAVYQAVKQFEIYTGLQPPKEFIEKLIKED